MEKPAIEIRLRENLGEQRVCRRGLVKWMLGGSFAVTAAGVLYPIAQFVAPISVGAAEVGQWKLVGKVSALPARGGLKAAYGPNPLWVIHVDQEPRLRALSAICTHLGCIVHWYGDKGIFHSPCHDGKYDSLGKVISGPPPRALPAYDLQLRGDDIFIKNIFAISEYSRTGA